MLSKDPAELTNGSKSLRSQRFFIWIGIVIFSITGLFSCMHSATTDQYLSDPKIMPVTSQALYSDIVAAWRHNIAEKLAPPESAKLITKVFRKHIPIGAPFSEVEDLLRKTGFEIDTDPFHFPHRKGERHDRTAASLSLAKSVFTRVTVHVYIIPETPNDFARSGELLGAFIVH